MAASQSCPVPERKAAERNLSRNSSWPNFFIGPTRGTVNAAHHFNAVSIVTDVSGYERTMTCRNGVRDGYDLPHQFLDKWSTSVYESLNHASFELEATLRMSPCAHVQPAAPHLIPPAHMVIQSQLEPIDLIYSR